MRSVLAFSLMLCLSPAAHAEPLDDLATAQQNTFDAWVKVPLTEQKVTFIKEGSPGYGMYDERGSNVFKLGEPMITYVEPIGYGWKEIPGDMYKMSFSVDVTVTAENGTVVGGQKNFSEFSFKSHNAAMECKLDLTMKLTGVPDGKYTLSYTIHDLSADQTSTFDQPIEIVAGS